MPSGSIKRLLPALQGNLEMGARAVVDSIPTLGRLRSVPLPRPRLYGQTTRCIHSGNARSPLNISLLRAGHGRPIGGPDQFSTPVVNTNQQRGKFTFVDVVPGQTLADLLKTPESQELQKNAKFVGFHATTDEAVKSIGVNGIDFKRTGQNWEDFSSAGPGLYTSKESRTVLWYGAQAVRKTPDSQLQLLAIFQMPADVMPIRMSLDDYATLSADNKKMVYEVGQENKYGAEFVEVSITPAGIQGPIEYRALPLPKFPLPKFDHQNDATDRMESELNEFVRLMQTSSAAGAPKASSYAIENREDAESPDDHR